MGAIGSTVVEVHWVISIQVLSSRGSVGVSVPERASVVRGVQHERIGVLAQSIQAWVLGQAGTQAQVLTFKDQAGGARIEEYVAVAAADDGEAERVYHIFELEICRGRSAVPGTGACEDF